MPLFFSSYWGLNMVSVVNGFNSVKMDTKLKALEAGNREQKYCNNVFSHVSAGTH